MIIAICTLTAIGVALGLGLSAVNHLLPVQEDPFVEQVTELLPGTQCGQCGYAGCRHAAVALIEVEAPLTICPPGGPALVSQLAEVLDRELDADTSSSHGPLIAWVDKALCTGCTKCLKACPTDALVGAAKQFHVVLEDACTGCGACVEVCEAQSIVLRETPETLDNWRWPKPKTDITASV